MFFFFCRLCLSTSSFIFLRFFQPAHYILSFFAPFLFLLSILVSCPFSFCFIVLSFDQPSSFSLIHLWFLHSITFPSPMFLRAINFIFHFFFLCLFLRFFLSLFVSLCFISFCCIFLASLLHPLFFLSFFPSETSTQPHFLNPVVYFVI